jgi:sirohydrochlorin cobaltochelatase
MADVTSNFDPEDRKRKAEAATAAADKAAPMASAPIKYNDDGSVAWDNMWDSFCVLAKEGGPAHRATLLGPDEHSDVNSPGYQFAQQEIIRGIYLVSGLKAQPDKPGWIAVECQSEGMAAWLADAGIVENVQVRNEGSRLFVPCGERFGIKGEIKSVVTVVAKTTHYWADHVPDEVKTTMKIEEQLSGLGRRIKKLFGRS